VERVEVKMYPTTRVLRFPRVRSCVRSKSGTVRASAGFHFSCGSRARESGATGVLARHSHRRAPVRGRAGSSSASLKADDRRQR
jgi:hypothetical protein